VLQGGSKSEGIIGQEGKSCAYSIQAGAHARNGLLRWLGSAFCNAQNHHNHGSASLNNK